MSSVLWPQIAGRLLLATNRSALKSLINASRPNLSIPVAELNQRKSDAALDSFSQTLVATLVRRLTGSLRIKEICALVALLMGLASYTIAGQTAAPAGNFSDISAMQTACAEGGTTLQMLNGRAVINLPIPTPLLWFPTGRDPNSPGQALWDGVQLDYFMVAFSLADIDETKIGDSTAFTAPPKMFTGSDEGDTTLVKIRTVNDNPWIKRATYDRDTVANLTRKHGLTAADMGGKEEQVSSATIPFSSRASARAFEEALRDAIRKSRSVGMEQNSVCGDNATIQSVVPTGLDSTLWLWDEGKANYFLRFYKDGTVIGVSSTPESTADQIAKWLKKPYENSGKYSIRDSQIDFFLVSSYGRVDYEGVMNGQFLKLTGTSRINNVRLTGCYKLVTLKAPNRP